ncbi:hypothetical protein EVC30_038 [Rhizobium phage RHph_Y1_11]|nr:hypothetical protein EVC30_038 [Rhizobium phage RHph_Y1_11]
MKQLSKEQQAVVDTWLLRRPYILTQLWKSTLKPNAPKFIQFHTGPSMGPIKATVSPQDAKVQTVKVSFSIEINKHWQEVFIKGNGVTLETMLRWRMQDIVDASTSPPLKEHVGYQMGDWDFFEMIVKNYFEDERRRIFKHGIDQLGVHTTSLVAGGLPVNYVLRRHYNLKNPDFPTYFIAAKLLDGSGPTWRLEQGNL